MSDRTSITVYEPELELIKKAKRDLEYKGDRSLSMHEAITEFSARHLNGWTCADCGESLDEGGFWVGAPGSEPPEGYERGARICHDCAGIPHREDIKIE